MGKIPVALMVILGIVAIYIVATALRDEGVDDEDNLKVEVDSGTILTVLNVGFAPLRVLDVSINGRSECKPSLIGHEELKVGDAGLYFSPCLIVRSVIKTSLGSRTYTFR